LAVANDFMLFSLYLTTGDAGVLIAWVRMNTRPILCLRSSLASQPDGGIIADGVLITPRG
jgi:hypothetical protein